MAILRKVIVIGSIIMRVTVGIVGATLAVTAIKNRLKR